MSALIVYGDIHGCLDEFQKLRDQIKPQKNDIEVCVGDIITKGSYSLETLRYIQKNGILSVLGNHEDKIIRYLKHQESPKKNPINLDNDEQQIVDNITPKDIEFLQSLPLFLRFDDITVVHGGLQNSMVLENLSGREYQKLLRLRYLDQEGHFVAHGEETEDSTFWADVYDGNQGLVVYGHQWSEESKISKNAIGVDTGCVYGNKLSAVVFDGNTKTDYKIISVKAGFPIKSGT
ncbi:metallophosphoesterase [Sulfuricurvum sp.]|uniref:metallophosphoesterase n=1 Tax=Sulfuricurvum sp. TaxID=2025608 RepID=UPI002623EF35|nr:metallophosphoesterase [Sulfuricurvum sp.]MDD2781983.1 metallophosphoesterase [Sulfuricurvum sp.]